MLWCRVTKRVGEVSVLSIQAVCQLFVCFHAVSSGTIRRLSQHRSSREQRARRDSEDGETRALHRSCSFRNFVLYLVSLSVSATSRTYPDSTLQLDPTRCKSYTPCSFHSRPQRSFDAPLLFSKIEPRPQNKGRLANSSLVSCRRLGTNLLGSPSFSLPFTRVLPPTRSFRKTTARAQKRTGRRAIPSRLLDATLRELHLLSPSTLFNL